MSSQPPWFLSRDQARHLDALAISQLGISGLLLMENAASGLCDHLLNHQPAGRIVIVCGRGNNGGDGLALYRQLLAAGLTAEVLLVQGDRPLSNDAEQNLLFLQRTGNVVVPQSADVIQHRLNACDPSDWIVDALLGTGLTGAARKPWDAIINAINLCKGRILSVDLPSGMDCDTGTAEGACVRADTTVTFVAPKLGFQYPHSQTLTGHVTSCHIGLPADWCRQAVSDGLAAGDR